MTTGRREGGELEIEPIGNVPRDDLYEKVRGLVRARDLDRFLKKDEGFFSSFMAQLGGTLDGAFAGQDAGALHEIHKSLFLLYEQNFATPDAPQADNQFHPFLLKIRNEIERAWQRHEAGRVRVSDQDVPQDSVGFSHYFKTICLTHPLSRHPLFDFLEFRAGRDEIVEFFLGDRALIMRFCDLVSMAMVGADDDVRGELAVNLWDEMGNGDPTMRHTMMYRRLLDYVGADAADESASTEAFADILDWQALAGYNLHLFFSLHRSNYFKSAGCLGSSELMDGSQYAKLLRGCRRVGIEDENRLAYYNSHVEIDATHGENWLANVLVPLVIKYPTVRNEIVLGAEMRLNVTADYFSSVLRKLVARERNSALPRKAVALRAQSATFPARHST